MKESKTLTSLEAQLCASLSFTSQLLEQHHDHYDYQHDQGISSHAPLHLNKERLGPLVIKVLSHVVAVVIVAAVQSFETPPTLE